MKTQHSSASHSSWSHDASAHWDLGEVSADYLEGTASAAVQHHLSKLRSGVVLVLNLKGTVLLPGFQPFEARQANLLHDESTEISIQFGAGRVQTLLIYYSAAQVKGFVETSGDTWPALYSEHHMAIDLAVHNAVQAMLACRFEGEIRRVFLLGKCLELLALFFEAHARTQRTRFIYCKTEYDRERLLFAREYLLQRFDLPPTLDELARIAGLNVFKLKNGFKELFGKPVFTWLNDYKMDLAQRELAQRLKSASQLAYDLGYSSLSHFSRAFRRHFGYPPGRVKKEN